MSRDGTVDSGEKRLNELSYRQELSHGDVGGRRMEPSCGEVGGRRMEPSICELRDRRRCRRRREESMRGAGDVDGAVLWFISIMGTNLRRSCARSVKKGGREVSRGDWCATCELSEPDPTGEKWGSAPEKFLPWKQPNPRKEKQHQPEGMAPWTLRPAAAAAVRRAASAEHSFHAGRALGGNRRRPLFSPLNRHNHEAVLMGKLGDTSKNLAIRDLLRESTESLILERKKKIGANNIEKMWMVGGISIVGYLFGTALGTLYSKWERRKLLEIKEALGISKKA